MLWLIPKTAREQGSFSFVRSRLIIEYISILPQHGASFCEGGVTPLQLLQKEAIMSVAGIVTAEAIVNYIISLIIRDDVGASKLSCPNQSMSEHCSVSLKEQTLAGEGEETSTFKSYPILVCKGEEMDQEMMMLESNDINTTEAVLLATILSSGIAKATLLTNQSITCGSKTHPVLLRDQTLVCE